MASESTDWRECTVQDLAAEKRNAIVGGPFGSNLVSRDYTQTGVPVIRGQNLSWGGREVGGEFVFVSDEKADSLSANLAAAGDIVFTQRGNAVLQGGQVAIVPNNGYARYVVSQSQMKLSPNPKVADTLFLYFVFRSHDHVRYLRNNAIVTGVPHTNLGILREYSFSLPPIEHQKAIAHILGTLDDKIELNRRMNETLESMARALFKSWFVDFDPVIDNALAAGNPIPEPLSARAETRRALGRQRKPLPKNIQKLFPNSFVFTDEMGWMPAGWELTKFSKLCSKIQNGGTPRRNNESYWENGTIPWLTSGEVRQSVITSVANKITEAGLENSSAKWLPANATVVAMYGATAGQVAYVSRPVTTNQAVCGLVPNHGFGLFNYLFLSGNEDTLAHQARGSAQQNINKGIIERTKVAAPPQDLAQTFDEMTAPYFQSRVQNMEQNEALAKLRDTLLPKLLSGELRIPEAEKLAAGSL